jgi:hypothetical protein
MRLTIVLLLISGTFLAIGGDTGLAVEKADAVQQEGAAVEDLLVERPDPPAQDSEVR